MFSSNYFLNRNRLTFNAIASFGFMLYFINAHADNFTILLFALISTFHFSILLKSKTVDMEVLKSNLIKNRILGNVMFANLLILFALILTVNIGFNFYTKLIETVYIVITILLFVIFNYKVFFKNS
jgi:hypothetical protein